MADRWNARRPRPLPHARQRRRVRPGLLEHELLRCADRVPRGSSATATCAPDPGTTARAVRREQRLGCRAFPRRPYRVPSGPHDHTGAVQTRSPPSARSAPALEIERPVVGRDASVDGQQRECPVGTANASNSTIISRPGFRTPAKDPSRPVAYRLAHPLPPRVRQTSVSRSCRSAPHRVCAHNQRPRVWTPVWGGRSAAGKLFGDYTARCGDAGSAVTRTAAPREPPRCLTTRCDGGVRMLAAPQCKACAAPPVDKCRPLHQAVHHRQIESQES